MRLLVVCEYAFIRESLCNLLQDFATGLKILGTANASSAIDQLNANADIDLLLYYLTDRQIALETLAALHQQKPEVPVLAVTDFKCEGNGNALIEAGARGCVSTEFTWQAIKSIMQRVINNQVVTPADAWQINESCRILYPDPEPTPAPSDDNLSIRLTPRQLEVLSLIKEGQSNKQIARSLNMAEATVKTHCSAIFRELGVDNRTQAAIAAEQYVD